MDYLVISNLLVVGALLFMTCPNDCRGLSLGYGPRDENSYQPRAWRVIPVKRVYSRMDGDTNGEPEYRALNPSPTGKQPEKFQEVSSNPRVDINKPSLARLQNYDVNGDPIQKETIQFGSADQKKNIATRVEPSYSSRLEICNKLMRGVREACREIVRKEDKRAPNDNEQNLNEDPTILQLQLW